MRIKMLGILGRHPARNRARDRAHRVCTVGQKQVCLLRGNASDAVMLCARAVAQLQHVAKDRNALAACFNACQHAERRLGRLGTCIVAVFNDRHAVFLVDLLAHAGIAEDRKLALDGLGLHAHGKTDRRRRQRVINHMPSQRRDKQLKLMMKAAHMKAHAVVQLLNSAGDHVAGRIVDAEIVFFVRALVAHVPQKRLIAVENADGVFEAAAQNVKLLAQNALAASQILDMRDADVRDDRIVRLRNRA